MKIRNRELLLMLIAVINFTNIVDSMLIMPLGDVFITTFGISPAQYSFLVAGYASAAAVSGLLGIFLIDRFDRRTALLFIYIGFSLGTLLCGFMESYASLLVMRIITGLFGGIIGALALSIISDLFKFAERGRALGYLFAAFSAASAFGVPFGIFLADLNTWQLPFIILGSFGMLLSLVIILVFPAMNEHVLLQSRRIEIRKTLAYIVTDRNQVYALITGFLLVLGHFLIIPFISPYMIRNVGFTQREIAYQFFLGGIATLFTSPFIGKMTDKIGVNKVFLVVLMISFIPTMLITTMGEIHLALALSATTLFFVFGSGRMIAPNTAITAAAPLSNRGSFMSMKSSLQQLAIAIAGILSGRIVVINENGLYEHYYMVGLLSIIIASSSFFYLKKIKVASGN